MNPSIRERLQSRYEEMWASSLPRIRRGEVECDSVLAAGPPDERRGLTLIARPSTAVQGKIAAFLDELRRFEPEQYYYSPDDLHLTVLSLFTATADAARFFARSEFIAAVDEALLGAEPTQIEFTGVTASPGAIMVRGFLDNDQLNRIRDRIRAQLQFRRLTETLDSRYRLETAHLTVARFRAPLRDATQLAFLLEQSRSRPFGSNAVTSFELVKNDWYMTSGTLESVKKYPLTAS